MRMKAGCLDIAEKNIGKGHAIWAVGQVGEIVTDRETSFGGAVGIYPV